MLEIMTIPHLETLATDAVIEIFIYSHSNNKNIAVSQKNAFVTLPTPSPISKPWYVYIILLYYDSSEYRVRNVMMKILWYSSY